MTEVEQERIRSAFRDQATNGAAGDHDSDVDSEPTDSDDEGENDIIDYTTFDQILQMDDDEDDAFSRSIVMNYFEQAQTTFDSMNEAMVKQDLEDISKLGHYLKGSSAALGLKKVKESCERLQNYGNCRDAQGQDNISKEKAEELITLLLSQIRVEYDEAELYLRQFYEEEDRSLDMVANEAAAAGAQP